MKEETATTTASPPKRFHPKGGVAADATFLENMTDQTSSILDLHRSNLLRLQANELVQECSLLAVPASTGISTGTGTAIVAKLQPSWITDHLVPYVDHITSVLEEKVQLTTINDSTIATCPFVLEQQTSGQTDTAKLLQGFALVPSSKVQLSVLPFHPPPTHAQDPKHFLGQARNCGWTKANGNAHVLPTFDLVARMPNSLWHGKDYLDSKYFNKRKLVLWQIAQTLVNNQNTIGTIHYAYDHGDVRKPYLVVVPPVHNDQKAQQHNQKKNKKRKQDSTSTTTTMRKPKFRLCIRLEMESLDWIPPLRLIPNRCNLKLSKHHDSNEDSHHPSGANISPMYNHAMLEDAYHSFLPSTTTSHAKSKLQSKNDTDSEGDDDDDEEHYPHWVESVVLAKIWCLQRGLLRAHDGFTTDQLALLILYLYRTKKANARMAPLQVLAALFKTILETQWCASEEYNNFTWNKQTTNNDNLLRNSPKQPMPTKQRQKRAVWVLPLQGRSEEQTIQHSALAKTYAIQTRESPVVGVENPPTLVELYRRVVAGPVFLDPTMRFNYLGRLSPNFMQLVQYEASRSLCCLHGPTSSSLPSQPADSTSTRVEKPFDALFLTPARFWDRFDLYVKVPLSLFRTKATTNTVKSLWHARLQEDLGSFEALARGLTHVLLQALGDRILSLRLLSTGNGIIEIRNHNAEANRKVPWMHLDSDEIPYFHIDKKSAASTTRKKTFVSPTGDSHLVLGVALNVDTCHRIVDRGPPAENNEGVQAFLDLWGSKAELRRFKDGAIVQAAIWNTTKNEPTTFIKTDRSSYVRYQNDDAMQGGIVERIINLILHRHFLVEKPSEAMKSILMSPLRDMASIIDGVAIVDTPPPDYNPMFSNPSLAFRGVMKAYEDLSSFLKEHSLPSLPVAGSLEKKESRLGIPLAIDAVEPLSPCLRYSELFPPLPHPLLGGTDIKGMKKIAGVTGYEPIGIQIRFGAFSKWPTDLKAISAAKTAMLIQLAKGIESMQSSSPHDCEGFAGPMSVTPGYLDLGFRGYVFRVKVRADPEIRLLRGLFKPTDDAVSLLRALTKEHIVSAMHHSMIHSITTKHASAGGVIRMASRWASGHMLSGLIPHEAIELLVAKVYTDRSSSLEPPGSVVAGFMRVLNLMASHDWLREPLIVDPHGHINDEDRNIIMRRFEQVRGPSHEGGPPMYIVSPNDRSGREDPLNERPEETTTAVRKPENKLSVWDPSFTMASPEMVVLIRMKALAKRSRDFLLSKLTLFDSTSWSSAFQETETSFRGYSALLRVDSDFVVDENSSSTGVELGPINSGSNLESSYTTSMHARFLGPKALRLKNYRNMIDDEAHQILYDWRPIDHLISSLRANFGSHALFFYNHLCPSIIALLWRPHVSSPQSFSVVTSEFVQPCVTREWKNDTMVIVNTNDLFREMSQYYDNMVTNVKLFQAPTPKEVSPSPNQAKKRKPASLDEADSQSESSENN